MTLPDRLQQNDMQKHPGGLSVPHGVLFRNKAEAGGTIGVACEPGKGTAFPVTLPAAAESLSDAAPNPIEQMLRKNRITVL